MTHARIAIHDLRPGTVEAAIRNAEEDLAPMFRGQPGFVAYSVYRVSGSRVASVSVWETHEAADSATRLADDWLKSTLPHAVVASHVVVGELAFESIGPALGAIEAQP